MAKNMKANEEMDSCMEKESFTGPMGKNAQDSESMGS